MKAIKLHIVFLLLSTPLWSQENIELKELDFNTPGSNEIAPFVYQNKLIYCSDKKKDGVITYTTESGHTLTDFYFVPNIGGMKWKNELEFAPELLTTHFEGPFTFDIERDRIYYTQNLYARNSVGNSLKKGNNMMIFSSSFINGEFRNPTQPIRQLDEEYNYICPSINAEGTKLFFSSDQPGGYGGYDIYVCEGTNGSRWGKPQNLGDSVNTNRDEIYPFAHISGRLYFSSRGHGGEGRHDIFYTYFFEDKWAAPISAGAPFNSRADDYGVFLSDDLKSGFFSSDRGRSSFDIYYFRIKYPIFIECEEIVENSFCFEFYDEGGASLDTMSFMYEWDFGDGTKVTAEKTDHCYDSPGTYFVQLNVIDVVTGEVLMNQSNYMLELEDINQVYINSVDTVLVNEEIVFDGLETNLENFEVKDFYWFMGDESEPKPGLNYGHKYLEPGDYTVKLGVTSTMDERTQIHKGCGSKKIIVVKR